MKQQDSKLLIAIPCYNEAEALRKTVQGIIQVKNQIPNTDVVVIDDGSTDHSMEMISDIDVLIVRHPVNLGLGASFKSAMNLMLLGTYDFLITIDADGQFLASEITSLFHTIEGSQWGLVTGSRFLPDSDVEGMPTTRKIGNKAYATLLQLLTRMNLSDVSCGFRAYSREALLNLNLRNTFTYTHETILQLAQADILMTDAPVTVRYFSARKSRISGSLIKYGFTTLKIVCKSIFILKPAQTFIFAALLFLLPTTYFGLIFFSHKLKTGTFDGFLYAGFIAGFFGLLFLLSCTFAGLSAIFQENNRKLADILYYTKLMKFGK